MDYVKPPCCNETSSCMNGYPYDSVQELPLAMAYVPWQQWKNVLDGCKGLQSGTIFKDLVFPFLASSPVCRSCEYANSSSSTRQRCCSTQEKGGSDCRCR